MPTGSQADFLNRSKEVHPAKQWDRLFLISLRKRYVFCPIAKVANSSLKAFLYEAEMRENNMGKLAKRLNPRMVHNLLYGPLIKPFQLPPEDVYEALTEDRFTRFIFVRHPVARLVSCYLDRVQAPRSRSHKDVVTGLGLNEGDDIPFPDFVEFVASQSIQEMNQHWRPQYHECRYDLVQYDNVYRFEAISEGMQEVLKRYYPTVADKIDRSQNYSPSSTGAGSRVNELVTPALDQLIRQIYDVDFKAFNYD